MRKNAPIHSDYQWPPASDSARDKCPSTKRCGRFSFPFGRRRLGELPTEYECKRERSDLQGVSDSSRLIDVTSSSPCKNGRSQSMQCLAAGAISSGYTFSTPPRRDCQANQRYGACRVSRSGPSWFPHFFRTL